MSIGINPNRVALEGHYYTPTSLRSQLGKTPIDRISKVC
jgi:hypothetical protein